jgi:hypothetical protein
MESNLVKAGLAPMAIGKSKYLECGIHLTNMAYLSARLEAMGTPPTLFTA